MIILSPTKQAMNLLFHFLTASVENSSSQTGLSALPTSFFESKKNSYDFTGSAVHTYHDFYITAKIFCI